MNEFYQNRLIKLPETWIGVRAAWELVSDNPWDQLITITQDQLSVHTHILGSSGAGKSNGLLHQIYHDLIHGISVCLFDLRGDLVSTVIELAAGIVNPAKVKILDLRERNRPFGFNPLVGGGEPYFRALGILDAIRDESYSWGVEIEETSRNILMALAEAGFSLPDMERFFYDEEFRTQVLRRVSSQQVLDFWRRYDDMSGDNQNKRASSVMNKFSTLFSTPSLRKILGHPAPFDLGKQLRTPGTLTLLSLAVDEVHAAGRMFGSIFLSCVTREVFSQVNIPEHKRNSLRVVVDEFENFSGSDFEAILAEGRRFKMSAILAHQTWAQLTPRMRSMILNNVGMKMVYRCGREDSATMSKDLFGDAKAYDFCELPRGYCVLWRRDVGIDEVEINEPLLKNVPRPNPETERFLEKVYSYTSVVTEPVRARAIDTSVVVEREPEREEPTPPRRKYQPKHVNTESDLEDWLCD